MRDSTPRVGLIAPGLGLMLLLLIGALLLIAAAPAQAQEPRLVGRLPDQARVQIDALLETARQAGLPTEPLIDRALEGAAKGAPIGLIVSAVTRLRDDLSAVKHAFGESASAAELGAGASAIRAGAKPADLAELRRSRPGQSLTVPTAVLADLVTAGVPSDTAVGAVLALAADAADGDYIAFRRNVQRDIALGASPASALGVRLRTALAETDTPGTEVGGGLTGRRRQKP